MRRSTRRFVVAGPLACLLLVQADCLPRTDSGIEVDPAHAPQFLAQSMCWPFGRQPPADYACTVTPFESPAACQAAVRPYLDEAVEAAMNAGLRFSENCFERTEFEGGPPQEPSGSFLGCERDCQYFYGDQPEGAPCESFGPRMSNCEQGLVCASDRACHLPCDYSFVAPEGGFCGPARGMWFVTCDEGLACGPAGTCEPAAAIGAACDSLIPCAVGGHCDLDGSTCVAQLSAGEECTRHEECASTLCIDGACIQPESLHCGRWGW